MSHFQEDKLNEKVEPLLFVYGTLKQGFANHHYLLKSQFMGRSVTRERYALYVRSIPFVVKGPPCCPIHGELYEVDKATLANIDALEGHPRFYCREQVEIIMPAQQNRAEQSIEAWLYFYPHATGELVSDGIYRQRMP